jgi:hypothetical protein
MKRLGIAIAICCACSTQTMASDAAWSCSIIEKGDDKPTTFKIEAKGSELFSLTYMDHVQKQLLEVPQTTDSNTAEGNKTDERGAKLSATAHKIVEDTEKNLVAVYAYPYETYKETTIDVILIDKTSGEYRQSAIGMKPSDDVGLQGTCLLSK